MSNVNEGEWVVMLRPQRFRGRDITVDDLHAMARQFASMPVEASFGAAFDDARPGRTLAWANAARVGEDGALRIRIVDNADATDRERGDVREHLTLAYEVKERRILCLAVSNDWQDGAPVGDWGGR